MTPDVGVRVGNICTYMHTYVNGYIPPYLHPYVHEQANILTRGCILIGGEGGGSSIRRCDTRRWCACWAHVYVHACMHTCAHTCFRICCTYIHTYANACTRAHIFTYWHIRSFPTSNCRTPCSTITHRDPHKYTPCTAHP